MIDKWTTLDGCDIEATDGKIGAVTDFFFDTHEWVVRYFVVDAGNWLQQRRVLISPESVTEPRVDGGCALRVNITKAQVRNSPPLDTNLPFDPQQEVAYREYFAWPGYWPVGLFTPAGVGVAPGPIAPDLARHPENTQQARNQAEQMRLRGGDEVKGYSIATRDGDLGAVHDYLLDEDGWKVRYMVVDTKRWLPGKLVLVAPTWIESVNWSDRKVVVDLTEEQLKSAPEYDKDVGLTVDYERALMTHYGRH